MLLIIDGYNLLKQISKTNFATEKERNNFILLINKYAHQKHHNALIVFDGGPYDKPTYTKKGTTAVLYSGTNKTADDVIKEYLHGRNNLNALVVSSDNELYSYVKKNRIPTIDSMAFYSLLNEKKDSDVKIEKVPGKAQKLHQEHKNSELDALMEQGANILMYKEEDQKTEKNGTIKSKAKLSKDERNLLKIAKKL